MTDIPRELNPEDRNSRDVADLDTARQAADASAALKSREHRRAEREQKAYESHYRDTPQSPR